MQSFTIKIEADAFQDIRDAASWYEGQSPGLGKRFSSQVKNQINKLKYSALNYAIRYSDVRCMLLRKFPFLVHYTVDE